MSVFQMACEISPPPSVEIRWQHHRGRRGRALLELVWATPIAPEDTCYQVNVFLRIGADDETAESFLITAQNGGEALEIVACHLRKVLKSHGLDILHEQASGPDL